MSVKKPVVPAAAEAPAAEAKPARKTAKSAVKTEKAPKTEKTAHKGRPPLSPEIYVEFAGKQYNIARRQRQMCIRDSLWTAPRPITA